MGPRAQPRWHSPPAGAGGRSTGPSRSLLTEGCALPFGVQGLPAASPAAPMATAHPRQAGGTAPRLSRVPAEGKPRELVARAAVSCRV